MPVDLGTGASVTFATSSFTANITSIGFSGMERASVDTSHLGTTTAMTFVAGDLYNAGELELEIQFDPDDFPPIKTAAETITVTFANLGGTTPADWEFTGFCTGFSAGVPLEELMTGTITIKITGDITATAQV